MILTDLVNKIHTDFDDLWVYVFEDEDERDAYRKNRDKSGLLFCTKSQFKMSFFLHERFAKAEVVCIFPVDCFTVDVVISYIREGKR